MINHTHQPAPGEPGPAHYVPGSNELHLMDADQLPEPGWT